MGQPDCWLCIWKWQTLLFLSKARINILDDDTECVNSKWVNQIVDSVFGNDKLCCFCPRPESTFWTMTQNASTQNLKFPILLFHINKVGARINQMGHHFNKMGARINKMGHSESTKCGAPTICRCQWLFISALPLNRRNSGAVKTDGRLSTSVPFWGTFIEHCVLCV